MRRPANKSNTGGKDGTGAAGGAGWIGHATARCRRGVAWAAPINPALFDVAGPISAMSLLPRGRRPVAVTARAMNPGLEGGDEAEWGKTRCNTLVDEAEWDEEFDMLVLEQQRLENSSVPMSGEGRSGAGRRFATTGSRGTTGGRPWTLQQSVKEGGPVFDTRRLAGMGSLGDALLSTKTKLSEAPRGHRAGKGGMLTLRRKDDVMSSKTLSFYPRGL